jgi:hypothetical protein
MAILNILRPFGIFYGYLIIFYRFGTLCHVKSGNPGFSGPMFNSNVPPEVAVGVGAKAVQRHPAPQLARTVLARRPGTDYTKLRFGR